MTLTISPVWNCVTIFALFVGWAPPSISQEFPPCTPSHLAEVEKSLPDLIVFPSNSATADEFVKLYQCDPGIPSEPLVFASDGAAIGKLKGQIKVIELGSSSTSEQYWIAQFAEGGEFAVNTNATDVAMSMDGIAGIQLTSPAASLLDYNSPSTSGTPVIRGPAIDLLKKNLAAQLTTAYASFNPVPSDRIPIRFQSDPSRADVWVGDVRYGATEVAGKLREVAIERIRLSLDGYEDCDFSEGTLTPDEFGWGSVFFCALTPTP